MIWHSHTATANFRAPMKHKHSLICRSWYTLHDEQVPISARLRWNDLDEWASSGTISAEKQAVPIYTYYDINVIKGNTILAAAYRVSAQDRTVQYRMAQSLVLDMNSMPPHYVSPNRHTLVAVSHSPILQWPKPKRIAPRAVPLLRMRYFLLLFSALAVPGHLGLAPGQIMRIVRSVMKSYSAFPFSCSMHVLTRKDSWPAGPSKPQYKIW